MLCRPHACVSDSNNGSIAAAFDRTLFGRGDAFAERRLCACILQACPDRSPQCCTLFWRAVPYEEIVRVPHNSRTDCIRQRHVWSLMIDPCIHVRSRHAVVKTLTATQRSSVTSTSRALMPDFCAGISVCLCPAYSSVALRPLCAILSDSSSPAQHCRVLAVCCSE